MKFSIYTLGCRVNQYESRVISEELIKSGYKESDFSDGCDIYIINSCAVTAESVRKSRQMIRRAKKLNPNAKIIVIGCFSQISPEQVEKLGCVDYFIGNKDKIRRTVSAVTENLPLSITDINLNGAVYEDYILTAPTRFREYIKIQDGCNGKCTYCVIPRARGPIRSKPRESVISEVKALAAKGVKEIILTGIEISAYEYDLFSLLFEINDIDGIDRISLGSLEPTLITPKFAENLSKVTKLTPHFHISVQSGSTSVLNRMRRKYNSSRLRESIKYLKETFPYLQLTCDIIVGFPGESDAEFLQTKEFLAETKFFHAHIFPYSIRPETVAAEMPDQISDSVKASRCAVLDSMQKKIKNELLDSEIKRKRLVPVLFESYKDGVNYGHSDNYLEYALPFSEDLTGRMVNVVPLSHENGIINAKLS